MYALEPRHGGVCKHQGMAPCILNVYLDVREFTAPLTLSPKNEPVVLLDMWAWKDHRVLPTMW
jgi:hypothetical protein